MKKMLLMVLLGLLFIPQAVSAACYNASFSNCFTVQINASNMIKNYTNTPLLLNISFRSGMQADFDDVKPYFYNSSQTGTAVQYQKGFTSASGFAELYVNMPLISNKSAVNNTLEINYGMASMTDESNNNTFSKSWLMEDGTAGWNVIGSTINGVRAPMVYNSTIMRAGAMSGSMNSTAIGESGFASGALANGMAEFWYYTAGLNRRYIFLSGSLTNECIVQFFIDGSIGTGLDAGVVYVDNYNSNAWKKVRVVYNFSGGNNCQLWLNDTYINSFGFSDWGYTNKLSLQSSVSANYYTTNFDNLFMWVGNGYNSTPAISYASTADAAPTVTIISPANNTVLQPFYLLNFTSVDAEDSSTSCRKSNESGTYHLGSISGTSFYSENMTGLSHNPHYATIDCGDSVPQNTSASVYWTNLWFNATQLSNRTNEYEANNTDFYLFLNISPHLSALQANAYFAYDGVNYSWADRTQLGTYYLLFRQNRSLGLERANNTAHPWSWNISVSGAAANITGSQNVWWYYFPQALANAGRRLEGAVFSFISNMFKGNGWPAFSALINFNGANYTASNSTNTQYSASLEIPALASDTVYNVSSILRVTWNGRLEERTASQNVTGYHFNISTCGGETAVSFLSLIGYEERTKARQNFTEGMALYAWASDPQKAETFNFSDTDTATSNKTYCFYPAWASFFANASIDYKYDPAFGLRQYFLINSSLSNATTYADLYLLNSTYDTEVKFTVQYSTGSKIQKAIVKALRWYPELNSYIAVAMGFTDSNGEALIKLELNEATYRFIVEKNGAVLQAYDKSVLSAATKLLVVDLPTYGQYFNYYYDIAYSCAVNTSSWLACTGTDPSNAVNSYNLFVRRFGATSWTTVCDNTEQGSAVIAACYLGNTTGNYYYYQFSANLNPRITLVSAFVQGGGIAATFGSTGLFISLMLTLALVLLGTWNPIAALSMAGLGLIASFLLGFNAINPYFMMGAIGAIMLLMWMVGRSER